MNFDKKALVGFITEIEASRDRAKGETRHQSEIFKKAREKGFEPKAMRQVLQRRAMKAGDRERMDELLDLYEHAMGALAEAVEAVQGGMSAREASERFGVPRGSLGAVVSGAKNAIFEPPHDADGVVIETQESCGGAGSASATHNSHHVGHAEGAVAAPPALPHDTPALEPSESRDTVALERRQSEANEALATPSVGAVADTSGSEEPRVAPPTDAEAIAAMDEAYERLQAARARRQTEGVGA